MAVDEAEQRGVELQEGVHDAKVHVVGHLGEGGTANSVSGAREKKIRMGDSTTNVGAEAVGGDPSDGLAVDFGLVVDALDGEEDLAQRALLDEVVLELVAQLLALLHHLRLDLVRLRHLRKEKHHRQAVVEVAHSVHKGGVAAWREGGG